MVVEKTRYAVVVGLMIAACSNPGPAVRNTDAARSDTAARLTHVDTTPADTSAPDVMAGMNHGMPSNQSGMPHSMSGHAAKSAASANMGAMAGMPGMAGSRDVNVNPEATARLKQLVARLLRDSVVRDKARSDTVLLRQWASDTAPRGADQHIR